MGEKWVFATLVALILMFGCVEQEYGHTVRTDGTSSLVFTSDMGGLARILQPQSGLSKTTFKENATLALQAHCTKIIEAYPGTKCAAKGYEITVSQSIGEDNDYYEMKVEEAPPYIVYRLTLKRLPTYYIEGDYFRQRTINLGSMDGETRDYLKLIEEGGGSVMYSVEMPSEIISATAGSINGAVQEKSAEFNLLQVSKDPAPIVIVSRELNLFWVGIAGGAVLLILALLLLKVMGGKK